MPRVTDICRDLPHVRFLPGYFYFVAPSESGAGGAKSHLAVLPGQVPYDEKNNRVFHVDVHGNRPSCLQTLSAKLEGHEYQSSIHLEIVMDAGFLSSPSCSCT